MTRIVIDTEMEMDTHAPPAFQARVRAFARVAVVEMKYASIRGYCASCGHVPTSDEDHSHTNTCRFAQGLLNLGLAREVKDG